MEEKANEATSVSLDPIYIDLTEWKEIWEFDKIVENKYYENGRLTIAKNIVGMTDEEILEKKILDLKVKVAKWTDTASEKSDLNLLIS